MNSSGMRITRQHIDLVSQHDRIRPLRDHIVLLPLEWEPSKTIKVAYWGKTLRGKVLAIGPGVYPKQYSPDRKKTWDSKAFRACDVKVNDIIELGGLELRGYDFPEIQWGTQRVIICREADVTGIADDGMGVPRCAEGACLNFVESSEDFCTEHLDEMAHA